VRGEMYWVGLCVQNKNPKLVKPICLNKSKWRGVFYVNKRVCIWQTLGERRREKEKRKTGSLILDQL